MKKIFKKILKILGYKISKIKQEPTVTKNRNQHLSNLLSVLKAIEFNPNNVIDIGANRGYWTRDLLSIYPKANVTMIEPQSSLKSYFDDLLSENPNINFLPIGVGSESGTFDFTISDHDDSSTFLLNSTEAKERGFQQVKIPVSSLNELLKSGDIEMPDLVKIDAEGLDMDVLNGATHLFGQTEIFLVEAAVNNHIFPNTFHKVINYMDENGYRLFDITDYNRPFKTKLLWLVELVFVKKGGSVDQYRITDFSRK
jgi:FkbM family methyltransferase